MRSRPWPCFVYVVSKGLTTNTARSWLQIFSVLIKNPKIKLKNHLLTFYWRTFIFGSSQTGCLESQIVFLFRNGLFLTWKNVCRLMTSVVKCTGTRKKKVLEKSWWHQHFCSTSSTEYRYLSTLFLQALTIVANHNHLSAWTQWPIRGAVS